MGRAKLSMELITKEKSRNITFKKRKEGLVRKMHEFTTLCDVSACMIIYGPKQEMGFTEPEIWPQDINEVRRIIEIYKAKNKDSGNKTFGLSDFFHDRKRKIEDELAKMRKKNMEAKYPTWPEFMNFMTEARLREFAAALSNKADYVKSRIEFLRRNREGLDMNLMDFRLAQSQIFNSPGGLRGIEYEVINQQAISSHVKPLEMHVPIHHYPTIDHQELHAVNQNSLMMLLMNDHSDHCVQFGGAASSSNIQCASYKRQVFYESGGRGMVDPTAAMMCHSPKPLARYYSPSLPLPVQVPVLSPGAVLPPPFPQLQFSSRAENNGHDGGDGQEDVVTYQYHQMNHNRARYYN